MSIILQVDFPYSGPWGEQMHEAMKELAQSITEEPGLIWKIWTENKDRNEAGGIYQNARKASSFRARMNSADGNAVLLD